MLLLGSSIMGRARAQREQLATFTLRHNPAAPDLVDLYLRMGEQLGVRGDVAYAQALLETHFFRSYGVLERGRHNFAGLGVRKLGDAGLSFQSPQEGVLAHVQALYVQAAGKPLPPGMPNLIPSLLEETRGPIMLVTDLARPGSLDDYGYGQAVARILAEVLLEPLAGEPYRIEREFLLPGAPGRPGARDATGSWCDVEGIVLHRSASPHLDGAGMRALMEYSGGAEVRSYHFVVDDKAIRQLVPVGEIAYHTDDRNDRNLGVMICEHNWGTEDWERSYHRLVWLVARLLTVFEIEIERLSGHFWWDSNRHTYDPTHLGWSPGDGQATGLFDWNRLVVDVFTTLRRNLDESLEPHVPTPHSDSATAVTESLSSVEAITPRHAPGSGGRMGARVPQQDWVQAAMSRMQANRYGSRFQGGRT